MLKKVNIFITLSIIFQLQISLACAKVFLSKKVGETNSLNLDGSGFFNLQGALNNQNKAFERRNLPDNVSKNHISNFSSLTNDAQLYLKAEIEGRGNKYGVVTKFEYNYSTNSNNQKLNLDQAFIYSENNFGKIEFGNNKAVNQQMKLGPARFARAAGGINGKYLEHVNLAMLSDGNNSANSICNGGANSSLCASMKLPRFILLAQSPIGHGGFAQGNDNEGGVNQFNRSRFRALKDNSFEGMEDATKISYYTPRIKGLQLGISYAPNTQDQGVTQNTTYNLSSLRIENVFSFGANYVKDFNNIGFGISATAEMGDVKAGSPNQAPRNDLFAYDIASTLTYFGFSFGVSYGSWGNSLQEKNGIYSCDYNSSLSFTNQNCLFGITKFDQPYYYTAGIGYEFGPFGTSLTAINSVFEKNKYQAMSFGLDYKYKKNMIPYIEFTKFTFSANQPRASNISDQTSLTNNQRQVKDNSGFVLLTGILISF